MMRQILKTAKIPQILKATAVRADYLIVGLGNPGSKYKSTRHNVGFLVIDELLDRHLATAPAAGFKKSKSKKSKHGSNTLKGQIEIAEVQINNQLVVLGKPHTFMNLSGKAVRLAFRKYKMADFHRLIIIHDELDLPPGRVQPKQGGGIAGHKGLASIRQSLGSLDFWRIRVGIGRPPSKEEGADYVLGPIQEEETLTAISQAADAVEGIIS